MKKKVTKPKPRRTLHLDTRVTPGESDTIKRKAEECGLTASDYAPWAIVPSGILRTGKSRHIAASWR